MDIVIVIGLVSLSGIFSGLTLGFFSLNLTSLQRKIKLGDERAVAVFPIRKNGNLLLCTLLLGNVAVNSALAIFLGNIATGIVAGVISTALIVVLGEIIPQAIFSRHALHLGARTVWLVRIFIFILYPIAYPLSWALDKALGEELSTIWDKREIEEIIRYHEEADESEIDEDEERILLGALAFSDLTANMIATPRPVVFSLSKDAKIDADLLEQIKKSGFSRIPIHSDTNKDQIEGVLLVRDLLGIALEPQKKIEEFIRPDLLFIKEDMRLDDLLNHFITNKKHLACLYDDFGSMSGVVSLEDIIEEILKIEIVDEVDRTSNMRILASRLAKKELLG